MRPVKVVPGTTVWTIWSNSGDRTVPIVRNAITVKVRAMPMVSSQRPVSEPMMTMAATTGSSVIDVLEPVFRTKKAARSAMAKPDQRWPQRNR